MTAEKQLKAKVPLSFHFNIIARKQVSDDNFEEIS
jgi:hypothetical protein